MVVLYANIFQPLIDVFEAVLKFFHNSIGIPWGWAIVLLTICVRAILVPLTVRQIRSMARMQQLAPEMKAIQAKYKAMKMTDPRRADQNKEMQALYAEHKVNPAGGCLPMLLQLPIWWALYRLLQDRLKRATIVSIGHRATLLAFHGRRIDVVASGTAAQLRDVPLASAAE